MFTLPSPQNNSFKFDKIHLTRFNKNGWLNLDDFANVIKKERNRSNRTGLPIAYVLIDFLTKSEEKLAVTAQEYSEILDIVLDLVTKNTRDFDIKHYCQPSQIGILLIDTDLQGAKSFIERISNMLYTNFSNSKKSEFIQFIKSISISSYPLDQMPGCDKIEGKPLLIQNLQIAKKASEKKLRVHPVTNLQMQWNFQPMMDGTLVLNYPILWDIQYCKQLKLISKFIKRLMDIIGSIVGIIVFSPVMILISTILKLTSDGPVFFKQQRYGYLGKKFVFLKFRTMECNNDSTIHKEYVQKLIQGQNDKINQGTSSDPLYKIKDDPRITLFGRFLRRTSLDEVPQFFNVLMGSMSLVGPRPPISYEVEAYQNWHYRRILEVKPGITGLWQVKARNRTTFNDMVRLDIQYVEQHSLYMDIIILLKTFKVFFKFSGK